MVAAKSNAQKQREHKERRERLGLKRLEVWARPADHAKIKAYAKRLSGEK